LLEQITKQQYSSLNSLQIKSIIIGRNILVFHYFEGFINNPYFSLQFDERRKRFFIEIPVYFAKAQTLCTILFSVVSGISSIEMALVIEISPR
jgi:hypothetical protein